MTGLPDTGDERYLRQTILPRIGPTGQEKLAKACVLIAGAGGLGSASAFFLAGAGVDHIKIVDGCDSYDHRQILNRSSLVFHLPGERK